MVALLTKWHFEGENHLLASAKRTWGMFQYKYAILKYWNSQYKNKMVSWLSYLYNEISYSCKDGLYIEIGPWSQRYMVLMSDGINISRIRQNGCHFAGDSFKCVFLNEDVWISIKISLKFVPKGPINNIPALFQIMAWCCPGDKPLSEPVMVRSPIHICIA